MKRFCLNAIFDIRLSGITHKSSAINYNRFLDQMVASKFARESSNLMKDEPIEAKSHIIFFGHRYNLVNKAIHSLHIL
jgi:hypothetical protein